MKFLNIFSNLFKSKKNPVVAKTIKEKIEQVILTDYVEIKLNPDICDQLIANFINPSKSRYELIFLENRSVKGLVKAVYKNEVTGQYYIELVCVYVTDEINRIASRKELVIMEHEIMDISHN